MTGTYREAAVAQLVSVRGPDAIGELVRSMERDEYRSRFGNWEKRAAVRVKPRRVLDTDGQVWFPPELVPTVSHPLVAARGAEVRHELLVGRLYDYLHFTTELEELAVIPIASKISRGRSGLVLPAGMRADAFKIVTDEAWHAQFSYDLMAQVETSTGVLRREPDLPLFIDRLDAVRARLSPAVRGAEGLMFAVVSETLISSILADLPRDRRLPTAVREQVRDHAEDEGRHHAYFRELLTYFWAALDPCQRTEIGRWLPEVILAFLEPDYRALGGALLGAGLSSAETEQVLGESYPEESVRGAARAAAASTVRYFTEVGALDSSRTADAFAAVGLIT